MAGTLIIGWNSANVTSAIHANDITDLKVAVQEIKHAVETLPVAAIRLEQLERFKSEAAGMFGALDGRLRLVENANERNSASIENIRSASGAKLR